MLTLGVNGERNFDFSQHRILHALEQSAAEQAWLSINQSLNVDFLSKKLIQIHKIPRLHEDNSRKQATLIRHCIKQAQEYYEAAKSATMATKPLQLYYCCMSLAQAEIMFFGTGEHSIKKLREQHGNHGFEFCNPGSLRINDLDSIFARPKSNSGVPWGTFGVWYNLKADDPVIGRASLVDEFGNNSYSTNVLLGPDNTNFAKLKKITLLDVIQHAPHMYSWLQNFEIDSKLLRAKYSARIWFEGLRRKEKLSLTFQPGQLDKTASLLEQFEVPLAETENFTLLENGTSRTIENVYFRDEIQYPFRWPNGVAISEELTYVYSDNAEISEFSYIYVGAYLLGMLCRYYPDLWMKEIESSSSFAQVTELLVRNMMTRLPVCMARNIGGTIILYAGVKYSV